MLKFVGHFHVLVEDRFGSRVGDRMWAASDPYLKVRFGPDPILDADRRFDTGEDREVFAAS